MENKMSKEEFEKLLDAVNCPKNIDHGFIYDCFSDALESASSIQEETSLLSKIPLNPVQLALYLLNEHLFFLKIHADKKEEEIIKDPGYETLLLSLSLDKYYTNERLAHKNKNFANRFTPEISTITLYINFVLGMLSRYEQGDPSKTLIVDILRKGFSMAQCIVMLLTNGFETEAFSTWRTLHENECILQVLLRYGKPVIDSYLKHLRYAIAFRGGISSKEETDKIFEEIKGGMRENDLKSKDMKRYIEYGWLLSIDEVKNGKIEEFKLNFRDGVERVAGLRRYAKAYEMSSEIAHSSPLLIYSRKNYFYYVTIMNLYESFFRLEKIFGSVYLSSVTEEEKKRYESLRKLYFGELLSCYAYEQKCFASLNEKKKAEA